MKSLVLGAGLAAMLVSAGCGGSEPMGKVKGTVSLDGQMLESGEVSAMSSAGYGATALITGGAFEFVDPLPLGKYTFTVGPPPLTEAPGAEGGGAAPPSSNIPDGYSDSAQSDLVHDIVEGDNDVKLEMKKEGPGK